jgi:oligoendopeptidase F
LSHLTAIKQNHNEPATDYIRRFRDITNYCFNLNISDESQEERMKLLSFLHKNSDAFAWSTLDLVGVSRDVIEHRLQASPSARPKKQKLRKMAEEKVKAAKAEVQGLLDAGFIKEVKHL